MATLELRAVSPGEGALNLTGPEGHLLQILQDLEISSKASRVL